MSLVQPQAWVGVEIGDVPDDDRELVRRARQDRAAFSILYRRHYRPVATYVYRRTGDLHATEDIVADVFLAALRTLPRFRYRGVPLRLWLLRIATNAVNRWARRQRRQAVTSLDVEAVDRVDPKVTPSNGEADVHRASQALLSLSPKFQTVLSLHYLEGLPIRDVAAVLGCREGTVKSRLSRARDALRQQLTDGRQSRE